MGMPLPPGMFAVIKKRHGSHGTLRDMCIFGKKFKAEEALRVGLVDKILKEKENGLEKAVEEAEKLAKFGENKDNFKKLKDEMYKEVVDCCYNKQHTVGVRG